MFRICLMLFILNILLFITGCSSNNNDSRTYDILNMQLEKSTSIIRQVSEVYLRRLDQKTKDPLTTESATIWNRKALTVILISDTLTTYLENIKAKTTVSKMNIDTGELYKKMEVYQQNIAVMDSGIYKEFNKEIKSLSDNNSLQNISQVNSNLALRSILSKIQNDIAIIGSKITEYCYAQIGSVGGGYILYEPIVSQNTKHLKNGETLIITAGVGSFFNQFRPEVSIDGKTVDMNQSGQFKFELKVSGSGGKYSIPVKIEYYDWRDTKESKMLSVDYFIDQ